MKKLLTAFCAFLLTASVYASPVTLNFQAVPLVSFAQATYQSMLGADYVIAPDVVALDKKISINVKSMDSAKLPEFVAGVLLQQGITVTQLEGIYYLDLVKASDTVAPEQKQVAGATPANILTNPEQQKEGKTPEKPELATETKLFIPQNRPAELIVEAINGAFGPKSAQLVGDRVLITATEKKMPKITALLADLDYQVKTVEVSASWVEVTHTTGDGLGISMAANLLGSKFSASVGSTSSGSALSITGTNFQFVLDALKTDNRFKQVSNSRMLGDAGQKIALIVGDETPTISTTSTNTAGNPVQNIVYRPSGLITNVTPTTLGGGRISVAVDGEISSFQTTTTGVAGSPTLIKRQLKTTVTIDDGEVLLIGGLNDNQTTKGTSGWSFLPASWATHQDSGTQTDLVLVLSAKVTNKPQSEDKHG